ncbi:MAG: patatin-like phospholipase family protein [Pseudomonadota bacterium]|uniref:patatin-like phospholipase family protein n=1 Tax=Gallaecimonas pentaromativorans TaxID=584787 RepID=UPI00067F657E|nr:patatin-like phospholipase family protein [Gallaecimonas pentaromativorans]MED5523257.1 patatin-like phospholipase family protein [Pseudomonadota bacterium]
MATAQQEVSVDLALQGGGSHGAFTWGVLDRLLQEQWLTIEGISGTSAGAMNAAVLVDGYAEEGRVGARRKLHQFWRMVANAAMFSPIQRTPLNVLLGSWSLENSPAYQLMDMTARMFSPYDLNPYGGNPLAMILDNCLNFERIANGPIKLFISATNVHTGAAKVFRQEQISTAVLLASACLPTLYHAVEIDGEYYWDGGYSGNPTLGPLMLGSSANDTILVQINPVLRDEIPTTAHAITNRINEVSFNAGLLKELRMIAFLRRSICSQFQEGNRWATMRMHRITTDMMLKLDYSSKLNAEWSFLVVLRDEGRRAAEQFLAEHGHRIGKEATLDLDAMLPSHE